jgi:hypothetical protein
LRGLLSSSRWLVSAAGQLEYRLRVTVNLVEMDATVADSQGNPVPDLKAGDLRVLLDCRPQLKYCNFIRSSAAPWVAVSKGLESGRYLLRVDLGGLAVGEAPAVVEIIAYKALKNT